MNQLFNAFFNEDGELNAEGLLFYAEAIYMDKNHLLPSIFTHHVKNNWEASEAVVKLVNELAHLDSLTETQHLFEDLEHTISVQELLNFHRNLLPFYQRFLEDDDIKGKTYSRSNSIKKIKALYRRMKDEEEEE